MAAKKTTLHVLLLIGWMFVTNDQKSQRKYSRPGSKAIQQLESAFEDSGTHSLKQFTKHVWLHSPGLRTNAHQKAMA